MLFRSDPTKDKPKQTQKPKVDYLKTPQQQNQATSLTQDLQDLGSNIMNTFTNLFK